MVPWGIGAGAQETVEFREAGVRIRNGGEFSQQEPHAEQHVLIVTVQRERRDDGWSVVASHFLRDRVSDQAKTLERVARGALQDAGSSTATRVKVENGQATGDGVAKVGQATVYLALKVTYLPSQRRGLLFWGFSFESTEAAHALWRDVEGRTEIMPCKYQVGPNPRLGCH
jgi:hypothetical protein